MNTTTTTITPCASYEAFEAQYLHHLADPDRPTAYLAYCRAEAWHQRTYDGRRRYANHKAFRNTMSRHKTLKKAQSSLAPLPRVLGGNSLVKTNTQVPINCQICNAELYRVPRGDIRTIIPHTCNTCIEKVKNLILG